MNFGLREKSGCLWKVEVEGVNKCLAHGTKSLKKHGRNGSLLHNQDLGPGTSGTGDE
jgi:hypothetical protein